MKASALSHPQASRRWMLKPLTGKPHKREALLKEAAEKHDAAVAKERKEDRVINRSAATAESKPTTSGSVTEDFIPAMPVFSHSGGSRGGKHCHQDKLQDRSDLMCFQF